jgi:hypothetical protein
MSSPAQPQFNSVANYVASKYFSAYDRRLMTVNGRIFSNLSEERRGRRQF